MNELSMSMYGNSGFATIGGNVYYLKDLMANIYRAMVEHGSVFGEISAKESEISLNANLHKVYAGFDWHTAYALMKSGMIVSNKTGVIYGIIDGVLKRAKNGGEPKEVKKMKTKDLISTNWRVV